MAPSEIKSTQPIPQRMVRQIYQSESDRPECYAAAFGFVVGALLGHPGDGCIVGFIAGCLCRHSLTSIKLYERDVEVRNTEAKNIGADKIARD